MAIALCGVAMSLGNAAESPGPSSNSPISPMVAPQDRVYPGEIHLTVDASDFGRRIVRVHESLSGIGPDTVLLYPKWLPGTHAPEGTIDRLAGLRVSANGAPVPWTRDLVDVFAFRIHAGPGIKSIDVDFDYLSPTSGKVGALEISREMLMIEWNEVVLYPAGYFTRQIREPHRASRVAVRFGARNRLLERGAHHVQAYDPGNLRR